jgi:hypothetical protein
MTWLRVRRAVAYGLCLLLAGYLALARTLDRSGWHLDVARVLTILGVGLVVVWLLLPHPWLARWGRVLGRKLGIR